MADEFPELHSFGTVFKYALTLESAVAGLARSAAERTDCAAWQAELLACAKKHDKRGQKLERTKRERLNEVVLQKITGMDRQDYLPTADLPTGGPAAVRALAETEERVERFCRDAADKAREVLTGVDRIFVRLADESRDLAQIWRAKVS